MDRINEESIEECCPHDPRVGGSPKNCPWIDVTNQLDKIQNEAVEDPENKFCILTAKEVLNVSQSLTCAVSEVVKNILRG